MSDLLQRLGLVARGGNLVFGEALYPLLAKNQVFLVILASDASANTTKKVNDKCTFYKVPLRVADPKSALGHAIGKGEVAALGITHRGLALSLIADKKEGTTHASKETTKADQQENQLKTSQ